MPVWLIRLIITLIISSLLCVAVGAIGLLMPGTPPVNYGLAAGWRESFAEVLRETPRSFSDVIGESNDAASKDVRLYRAALFVESPTKPFGQQFRTINQGTGDCVSQGVRTALRTTMSVKAAKGERKVVEPFAPYIFGTTRKLVSRWPCGAAGADPSAAMVAFEQYGIVTEEEAGVPYSGALANRWACTGPPDSLLKIGKQRAGSSFPIRSADELCQAINNGYACTWATGMKPSRYEERDGRWVVTRWGGWAHQMAITDFDGSRSADLSRKYFNVWNSHSEDPRISGHPLPLGDEPPGSFWMTWKDIDRFIKSGDSVVYAISDVQGFEADDVGSLLKNLFQESAR